MGNTLLKYEFYNQQSAEELLDQVYDEFESKEGMVDSFITPTFYNVVDGFTKKLKLTKYGVTTSRVMKECKDFNYSEDLYVVKKELKKSDMDKSNPRKYSEVDDDITIRNNYKMNKKYKKNHFKNKETGKDNLMAKGEYTGKKIYHHKNDAKKRNYKDIEEHYANTDHIIPAKTIYEKYKHSPMLSEYDIKDIINKEKNFAVTSARLNHTDKNDRSNMQTWRENHDKYDLKTKIKMSTKQIEAGINTTTSTGKKALENVIKDKNIREKTLKINDAKDNAKNACIGEALIMFIKPLYYELKNCFKNGITYNLDTDDVFSAFNIRMKRVTKYVKDNVGKIASGSLSELIKSILTALFDAIIKTFASIFINAWRIIRQGFSAIIEAIKLIANPPENMSKAERADAVVKIISTAAIGILSISFESWLNSIGIVDSISGIITGILSGLVVAFVSYLLDKIDLFDVKREIRMARIEEVFNARKKEIKDSTEAFDRATVELLTLQRMEFDKITDDIYQGIDSDDLDKLTDSLYEMAGFMETEVSYSNTEEFLDFLDNNDTLEI